MLLLLLLLLLVVLLLLLFLLLYNECASQKLLFRCFARSHENSQTKREKIFSIFLDSLLSAAQQQKKNILTHSVGENLVEQTMCRKNLKENSKERKVFQHLSENCHERKMKIVILQEIFIINLSKFLYHSHSIKTSFPLINLSFVIIEKFKSMGGKRQNHNNHQQSVPSVFNILASQSASHPFNIYNLFPSHFSLLTIIIVITTEQ
jgi:hypothetical protein